MKTDTGMAKNPELRGQGPLRQFEQRMRLYIEHTPLAVIEWDRQFRVLQWNPAAERIFGFTAAEVIGRHGAFILPDSVRPQVDRIWSDLLGQKGGGRSTNENLTRDGRIICCEWYNTAITDDEGQVIGVTSLAQDITEREHAQRELQLFKLSLDNSSDAIGMSTPQGVHYYQNKAFEDLFGQIGTDPTATLYVKKDVGDKVFSTIMAGGQWSGEVEMRGRDGRALNILLRAYANKDAQGRIIGLVGIHTDISERKLAGEQLRESRNLLSNIQQISHTCGWQYDLRTNTNTWSDEMYRLLGYEPGSFEPTFERYWSHIHPDDRDTVRELHLSMEEISENIAYRIIRTDGSVRHILTRNRLEHEGETPVRLYGAVADITELKQAEQELKASRDNFELIFQTSPDIIMFSDNRGTIAAVNGAVEKILEYTPQELIGRSHALLTTDEPGDTSGLRKVLEEFSETGFLKAREAVCRKKSGGIIYLEVNARALRDEAGGVTGSVSVMRDITDRKKMEAQLRQSQKMEAIGTLAGGIAHDFNNILAAIMGYVELSQEELAGGLSVEHNLEQIMKSTVRARDLIRQILAFSRKDMEERAPLQVSSIIKEAVKLLRATLPSTIRIRESISDQPSPVNANPTQIHQVLMNLCTNAAHAMSEGGGVLSVGVQPVFFNASPVSGQRSGAYVKITISDTGHGIQPQIIDRIFEPFFTTKDIGKGTGMGLAVAHGIVKSHGGEILVSSEPGRGSTFEVLLPQVSGAPEAGDRETMSTPRGSERIMFIDDEEMLLELGQNMLQSLGYAPTVVHSSTVALDIFRSKPDSFDLVISDMTMPRMPGDVLAREMLRIRPGLPIIIATGYSENISEEAAREIGVRAVVLKPLTRRELAKVIRAALDKG